MAASNNDRMPPPIDGTNLALQWPGWKRHFLIYMAGKQLLNKSENVKIAQFLMIGDKYIIEIYNALYPNDGTIEALLGTPARDVEGQPPQRTLDEVLKRFDEYITPQKNIAMEAFKFNSIVQKEHQPFAEFETELRKQIQHCEFKCTCGLSYESRMLRDRIIIGVVDKTLQVKLLNGKDEPLNDVIEKCKVIEAANANKVILQGEATTVINIVEEKPTVQAITRKCYNCGGNFTPMHIRVCKAAGVTCFNCGRKGHFQKFCKQPKAALMGNNKPMGKEDTQQGAAGRTYNGKQKQAFNVCCRFLN